MIEGIGGSEITQGIHKRVVDRREGTGTPVSAAIINVKSRTDHPKYIEVGVHRLPVPDEKVRWSVAYPEYDAAKQETFDHPNVVNQFAKNGAAGWAAAPSARAYVGSIQSYEAHLPITPEGEALNPGGRTGIKDGRGLLGKWGPNFAADPIIMRVDPSCGELQVLLIQRGDTGAWALPGGMTDFGEKAPQTLRRELREETGLDLSMADAVTVYTGYVDDPRNTDKAWMETVAAVRLLSPEEAAAAVIPPRPEPKDGEVEVKKVEWVRVDGDLLKVLYASHAHFVSLAIEHLAACRGEELQGVAQQLNEARGYQGQECE